MMPLIDVHTHVYPPRYVAMLRHRTAVPRIISREGQDRMLLLPGESNAGPLAGGRPIGSEFWDPARKRAFMDHHGIAASLISPANPWLDFLSPAEQTALATEINEDLEQLCADSGGRFLALGVLPFGDPPAAAAELQRIAGLPHLRGAAMGSLGAGKGLDDPSLDVVWEQSERSGSMLFLHPHYGSGTEGLGRYGVAPLLGMGFPFETAGAVARLILSGTFDRFSGLRLLVAHGGGALPYLASRLDACVAADYASPVRLRQPPSAYLRNLWYDAITYQPAALRLLMELVGRDRIMFGSDAPFFAPNVPNDRLDSADWHAVVAHRAILNELAPDDAEAIGWRNATTVFGIALPSL
jgi:aminocarboxymuconate-semialdehyde decarboxylase